MKLLIDSSVWLEYFAGGPKAGKFEKYFKPPNKIILPSIVSYEVFKKIKSLKGENAAVSILAQMERVAACIIPVDQSLAVNAADLSLQFKIPMADAMIYSSALSVGADIVTMDAHFRDLPGVQFVG